MVQPAVVAQGELAVGVDLVVADAVVAVDEPDAAGAVEVPLIEDVLGATVEEQRHPDFQRLIESVADERGPDRRAGSP